MCDSEGAPIASRSPDGAPTLGPLPRASLIATPSVAAPSSCNNENSDFNDVPCSRQVDVDAPPVNRSDGDRAATNVVATP